MISGAMKENIKVDVKVATILCRRAAPPLEQCDSSFSLERGATIADVIALLGIPRALVGSVTVNKKRSPDDYTLQDGDKLAIIPAISGG